MSISQFSEMRMSKYIRFVGYLLFIVAIFILLYAYAMFQGGFVSWFLFFSFLPISLYQVGLLFYPLRSWKIERTLSQRLLRAGDSITVTITIKRKIPFPLFYCVFEEIIPNTLWKKDLRSDQYHHLNEPNKLVRQQKIKQIIFPWFRREFEVQYELGQVPRGEHQLKWIQVRTGDVFGFIKKDAKFQLTNELIVSPRPRPIRINGEVTYENQGEKSIRSPFQINTNVVTGVREYVAGDKISWIDWKQTARNHVMMSKEFEQEKSSQALLVLNACHNENFNSIAFEAAIELTLSIIIELENKQSAVELLSIGNSPVFFQMRDLNNQKEAIRQYLTRVQPSHLEPFTKQLVRELTTMGRQSFVMMITPHLDTSLYESIQKISKQIDKLVIIYIQSEANVLQEQLDVIQQLESKMITTTVLTEKELVNSPIEVRI